MIEGFTLEDKIEILKSVHFGKEDWVSMKHRANIMNELKDSEAN